MKFLEKIFSIKNEYEYDNERYISKIYKCITFFGMEIRIKRKIPKIITNIINRQKSILNELYKTNAMFNCRLRTFLISEGYVFGNENLCRNNLNTEALYKNLDDEAKKNLDIILDRNEKIVEQSKIFDGMVKAEYVYTPDEMIKYKTALGLKNEVIYQNDYYEWKNYKLPVNFFEPAVFIDKHGVDFIKNKEVLTGAIIDAGANMGDSALVFRSEFPNNLIISFEPEKKNYLLLKETVKLNNLQNIVVENSALGEASYKGYADHSGIAGFSTCIKETGINKINVDTIDNYVEKNNLKISVIKTDVEGYEQKLLMGAINTIKQQKPVLLISIYHSKEDFCKIKPLIENIAKEAGFKYRFDFFKGISFDSMLDTMLICEPVRK